MKAILLLNDEIAVARLQLVNGTPDLSTTLPNGGSVGCNCDRWGHPCARCGESTLKHLTQLPISESNQEPR
jgi:hypothetical protein